MNTHYVIPGAIALALHAAVFFGFGHSRAEMPRPHLWTPLFTCGFPVDPDPAFENEIAEVQDSHCGFGALPVARPDAVAIVDRISISDLLNTSGPTTVNVDSWVQLRWSETISDPRFETLPVAALDDSPNARRLVTPDYPYAARSKGLTGEVLVKFIVDTTGSVHDAVVVRSSDRIFEEAALRAILQWRFQPGKHDGRLVSFRMAVPVVFNLSD